VTKLLFFALLAVGVVLWFKHKMSVGQRDIPPPGGGQKPVEDMVRCKACGVNLPRSEAILSQGRFYCSDEHRRGG